VKLTEAVPEVEPAATLMAVGAPGTLLEELPSPHAARKIPSTTGMNNLIVFIYNSPFPKKVFNAMTVQ
jgi:hypothetical protein